MEGHLSRAKRDLRDKNREKREIRDPRKGKGKRDRKELQN